MRSFALTLISIASVCALLSSLLFLSARYTPHQQSKKEAESFENVVFKVVQPVASGSKLLYVGYRSPLTLFKVDLDDNQGSEEVLQNKQFPPKSQFVTHLTASPSLKKALIQVETEGGQKRYFLVDTEMKKLKPIDSAIERAVFVSEDAFVYHRVAGKENYIGRANLKEKSWQKILPVNSKRLFLFLINSKKVAYSLSQETAENTEEVGYNPPETTREFFILDLENHQTKKVRLPFAVSAETAAWFPDGRYFITALPLEEESDDLQQYLYKVDTITGKKQKIPCDENSYPDGIERLSLTNNGKTLYFTSFFSLFRLSL